MSNLIIALSALGFFGCLAGMGWAIKRLNAERVHQPKFETTHYRREDHVAIWQLPVLLSVGFAVWVMFF